MELWQCLLTKRIAYAAILRTIAIYVKRVWMMDADE